jgi:hypothetical protein
MDEKFQWKILEKILAQNDESSFKDSFEPRIPHAHSEIYFSNEWQNS